MPEYEDVLIIKLRNPKLKEEWYRIKKFLIKKFLINRKTNEAVLEYLIRKFKYEWKFTD